MALLRRRRNRSAAPPPAHDVDVDDLAERLLDTAEGALGRRPALAAPPEPLPAGAGPGAYTFELAGDDPAWSGTLVARLAEPEVLRNEVRWAQRVAAQGYDVPAVLGDRADEGLVVLRPPGGDNLALRMATDLMALPGLLAGLGKLHARLHALPTDGSDGSDGADVICHGALHPGHVYLEGKDLDAAVVVNWTGARLAGPAYDVAATLAFFWTSPLFVDNVAQRSMLKMARDSLASAYLSAYNAAAPEALDDGRLAYWQAHHLEQLAVEIERLLASGPTGPWDPAAGLARPDKALAEVRERISELAA